MTGKVLSSSFSDMSFGLTTNTAALGTTWSPSDKASVGIFLTNSNLTANFNNGLNHAGRATTSKTAGKWYFEGSVDNWLAGSGSRIIGIMTAAATLNDHPGADSNGYGFFYSFGSAAWFYITGNSPTNIGGTSTGHDVLGICLDKNNNKVYVRKDGVDLIGDPVAGIGGLSVTAEAWFAGYGGSNLDIIPFVTGNFGATPFAFTPPSGFVSWG